jgi:hypothetical protein
MNCAIHTDTGATGYCRNCGKALCPQCIREVRGSLYCEPCLSSMVARAAVPAASSGRHPWLAFALGWVPGLGAVYNGEYVKALVHIAIFAGLVTLDAHGADQPLWGLVTAFFICYMPIEAFITARDELKDGPAMDSPAHSVGPLSARAPVGPIVLIVLGVLFLFDNLGILHFDWVFENGWPVLLIGLGVWMLWKRTRRNS